MRFSLRYKNTRYLYWLLFAFFKKNIQSLIISFLISLIFVIAVFSFSPYIIRRFTTDTHIIGMTGQFRPDSLPDEVLSKISNGLVYLNDRGEIIPLLAESWSMGDGGASYRFVLKKDIVWSDGKQLTSSDINYSFKDVKIDREDDYIITYTLPKPLRIFPQFLTRPVVRYPLMGVAGTYRVDKLKLQDDAVSELRLTPLRDEYPVLVYKFYDTDTKLVQAYKLGEITQMSTTKASVADIFVHYPNSEVEKIVDYSRLLALFFNMKDSLLKERDVRHAIAQSINTDELNDLGELATGPIPPNSWAYETDVKSYPYNPSATTKIFKKYITASESAKLTITTYIDYLSTADTVKDQLEQVGIQSQVEVLSGELPETFQLFLATMMLPKDPDQYFFWHSTQKKGNISSYRNDRIDLILEQGRNAGKLKDRRDLYSDFQKILVNDMPAYFLFYPYSYTISRK